MLVISKEQIINVYSMQEAIIACKKALTIYSQGNANIPIRTNITTSKGQVLFMPGYETDFNSLGIKIVSVYPENTKLGKPVVVAQMLLMDGNSGELVAILDGTYLTQLRTGALQGLATDILAKQNSHNAVLIGVGGQAKSQLEAMLTVRKLKNIAIINRNRKKAEQFIQQAQSKYTKNNINIYISEDHTQDIANADIITAVTTSKTPVFDGAIIQNGVHINGMGAYTPDMQELPLSAIKKADILTVDTKSAVLTEAGDIMHAIQQNIYHENNFYELAELVINPDYGRQNNQQITLFKSVGSAILDIVVAQEIYQKIINTSQN